MSKYQEGFREKVNFQHLLLVMFEKLEEVLDNGGGCDVF